MPAPGDYLEINFGIGPTNVRAQARTSLQTTEGATPKRGGTFAGGSLIAFGSRWFDVRPEDRFVDSAGRTFRPETQTPRLIGNGWAFRVVACETGAAGNLAPETRLRWRCPPAYALDTVEVSSSGLTGGSDGEMEGAMSVNDETNQAKSKDDTWCPFKVGDRVAKTPEHPTGANYGSGDAVVHSVNLNYFYVAFARDPKDVRCYTRNCAHWFCLQTHGVAKATIAPPPLLSEPTYSPADAVALAQQLGRAKEENEKLRAEVERLMVHNSQRNAGVSDHYGNVAARDNVIRRLEEDRAELERELSKHDPRLVAVRRKNRGAL